MEPAPYRSLNLDQAEIGVTWVCWVGSNTEISYWHTGGDPAEAGIPEEVLSYSLTHWGFREDILEGHVPMLVILLGPPVFVKSPLYAKETHAGKDSYSCLDRHTTTSTGI